MKKLGFLGKTLSHLMAILLGVGLTFGVIGVATCQAAPLYSLSTVTERGNIALKIDNEKSLPTHTSFVNAAIARTGSAVVRIDTERTVASRVEPMFEDPFFREFFGDRFRFEVPQERQIRGQGSGFIIDKNGIIMTNAHVVSRADKVTVTLKDGRVFDGQVTGTDEVTDLAVVRIDTKGQNLPVAPLGSSSDLEVGDWAIAVGNPVGLNNTVTLGIISTLSRSSAQVGIPDKRVDFLQTDAAINPGNSGGPLLNERGEVIGINTAIRPDANGIGFAIPIDKAKSLKDTLAAGEIVPHPYIGVQMLTLTPEMARENNQNPNSYFSVPEIEGVLVLRVMPNSPAEKAGIRRGDVIVSVDGQKILSASQLQILVENSQLAQNLQFEIQRGDLPIQLSVKTTQLEGIS